MGEKRGVAVECIEERRRRNEVKKLWLKEGRVDSIVDRGGEGRVDSSGGGGWDVPNKHGHYRANSCM